MFMSFYHAAGCGAFLGASSHRVFKRSEPKILPFLSWLVIGNLLTFFILLSTERNRHAKSAALLTTTAFSAFLAGLSLAIIRYRLSPRHPLANYPGPTLAKISKWWMGYWIAKGTRHVVLQRLHQQYGPWLRIGPNEISVNIPAAVRPVYGQMFRAPSYQAAPQEADALITTTDRTEHAQRLVAWNTAFSGDSLKGFRPLVQARTTQLLDILRMESNNRKGIDLSHWITLWTMDVMGDMSFSGGFETMAAGKDSEGWIDVLQMGVFFVGILGQVPWMRDMIAMLPQPGPIVTFQQFAGKKVKETKSQSAGVSQGILGIIQDESSGGPPLSDQQAAADASFIVVAGSDTVSQALTSFFRYVVGDREVQSRLRAELYGAFEGPVEDMDALTLAKLPYLDACIQETLRLVPPVAAGPPRHSGTNGAHVMGRFIPPGTTVACPTYTLHRDPCNFKDPERFQPERWSDEEWKGPHNPDAFIPFSYGLGVCIGKKVALYNMKLLAASILRTFELSFPEDFDVQNFDGSYKEHNLWLHDPLSVQLNVFG